MNNSKYNHNNNNWNNSNGNDNYNNYGIFGNVSVTGIDSGNYCDDNCINEMRQQGFKDNVLNRWKLTIYNGNVSQACRYYYYDEWCHQHCIFGTCKNENQCKGNHRHNLTYLIEKKEFKQAKLLCQYLLHFYTTRCVKQNMNKKRAWIAHLHWKLAQVYAKDGFSNYYDYKMAQSHYEHAIKVCYCRCYAFLVVLVFVFWFFLFGILFFSFSYFFLTCCFFVSFFSLQLF